MSTKRVIPFLSAVITVLVGEGGRLLWLTLKFTSNFTDTNRIFTVVLLCVETITVCRDLIGRRVDYGARISTVKKP